MLIAALRPALSLVVLLLAITGIAYPLAVSGVARLLFPAQAAGSLVVRDGAVVGSALIGQPFSRPEYLHPRPSAAGQGYDATASGGTNKGPTDRTLADSLVATAIAAAVRDDGATRGAIPADYVTSSGSGLDPHLSPASARVQVARVARVRGADSTAVRALVERHIEGRTFGVLGEPRVNVLLANLDLDRTFPVKR